MSNSEKEARQKRLEDAIKNGETIDLAEEALNTPEMVEMMEGLTDEQLKEVRKAIAPIADNWQDILAWAMEGLEKPGAREKFVEEAKKRYSSI